MKEFKLSISPSLNFKVLLFQYQLILKSLNIFKNQKEAIDFLIYKITLEFSQPEKIFVAQGDTENKDVYFSGAGKTMVTRQFNQKFDILFGEINSGQMMNEKNALFNSSSEYTLRSKSYCQLGIILHHDFQDMCALYKDIKEKLTKNVIRNPFNIE